MIYEFTPFFMRNFRYSRYTIKNKNITGKQTNKFGFYCRFKIIFMSRQSVWNANGVSYNIYIYI